MTYSQPATRMPLILVIEDEKTIRENTVELLEGNHYECIWANNGQTGLELACSRDPSVIVCDIALPILDGYQIKTELNKLEHKAQIPFIFLTAKTEREDLRNGMNLGAADFITKPFKISELIHSIERRLQQQDDIHRNINNGVIDRLSNFTRIAKHECNTPLNAILNLSQILMTPELRAPENVADLASGIHISGKRLNKTLNNLIDLIRLQHYDSDTITHYKHFSLDDCIEQLLQSQARVFKRTTDTAFDRAEITCTKLLVEDATLLFSELINNAFKFSDPGTPVQVKIDREPVTGAARVTICNRSTNVIHFTQQDIAPFNQFNRHIDEQQGSGLGLYIAQLICRHNGGELTIASDNNGHVIATAIFRIE